MAKGLGKWLSKIKLFRKNPGGKRTHVATLTVRGKTKKQAAAKARHVMRHYVKNIAIARGTRLKSATKHGRIR